MDRRTFLALAATAVGTAGCTADSPDDPPPTPSAPARDDPDALVRDRVALSEAALIAAYRAALVTEPALTDLLTPVLRQHEEHLRLVAPGWTGPTAASAPAASGSARVSAPVASPSPSSPSPQDPAASGSGTPGAAGSAGPSARATTGTPTQTLESLGAAESAAKEQRISACDGAVDPNLARLLCLVAASEAQHAAVLARAMADAS